MEGAPGDKARSDVSPGCSPSKVFLFEDEDALLRRYAGAPSRDLEAEIVQRFMPLVRTLVLRYRGSAERNEDLMQVGSLALVKALRRYEPERGNFASYAAPSILGELRRYFRDHSWRLHVPRGLQEDIMRVERTTTDLTDEIGRVPTVAQIADRSGLTQEKVLDVIQARDTQAPSSLDKPASQLDPDSASLVEGIGRVDSGFDSVEAQFAVDRCANLTEREREVIALRFVEDLTQREIGDRVGVSQMQVSRDMRRALAKMLEAVQGAEPPEGSRTYEEAA